MEVIKTKLAGDIVIVPLEGKIMGCSETKFIANKVQELLMMGCNKIILDFEKVNWINSLGIGALIKLLLVAREKGGDLRFINAKNKVNHYLKITKLLTVIKTFESPQEAINSFYVSAAASN